MCSLFAYSVISAVFFATSVAVAAQAEIQPADGSNQNIVPAATWRTDSGSDKHRIEPSDDDKSRYRELIRTGWQLAKLLNVSCGEPNTEYVVSAEVDCSDSIPGNGSSFSFRTGKHCPRALSDIKLREGLFVSGSKFTLGVIADLGDVAAGSYSESDPRLKFIENLLAPSTIAEAKGRTDAVNRGIVDAETLYTATVPVRPNGGYAIRSMAFKVNMPIQDKRADMTAVFSVVRIDERGNVTILWKPVQVKDSPLLRNDR